MRYNNKINLVQAHIKTMHDLETAGGESMILKSEES